VCLLDVADGLDFVGVFALDLDFAVLDGSVLGRPCSSMQ